MRFIRVPGPDGRKKQVTIPQALEYATALYDTGSQEAAERVLVDVLRFKPTSTDELHALGAACFRFGRYGAALESYERALRQAPNKADLHSGAGATLASLGRLEEAIAALQRAVSLNPRHAAAHANLGEVLVDVQRYEEAVSHCLLAVEIDPHFTNGLNNLGRALERLNRDEEAETAYRRVLELEPGHAQANYNLGALLHRKGELDAPRELFARGAQSGEDLPEAHYNHALLLLRQGDFAHGFEEYEWRWRCNDFPSPARGFDAPQWQGEELAGRKILLHAEQGVGDAIQFARYAPLVTARGGRVLFEVQPELKELMQSLAGVETVLAKGDFLPAFDLHCPLLSLPRAISTRVDTIPAAVPYLHAEPGLWRSLRRGPSLHAGLVWAGNPGHVNDRNRSMPLEAFSPLAQISGIRWFSLQKGPASAEAAAPPAGLDLQNLAPDLQSFADTAAILQNLDLVVTVDTAVAHLAGALGLRVWVLLPHSPDWRWMLDREDSPWYPTMRLFRQPAPGDWGSVIERLAHELEALVPAAASLPPRASELEKRSESDLTRWSDPARLDPGWDRRARIAADFLPAGSSVLDLGCGAMALERSLPPGCEYLPCDLVRRDERTQICDFNRDQFPDAPGATISTLLGVLEYIHDWKGLLRRVHGLGTPVVLTYCATDFSQNLDRAALGWVNHLSLQDLTAGIVEAGFSIRASMKIDGLQVMLRLHPDPPAARVSRSVLVLSANGAGNFGDRLGYHLMNAVLPPEVSVTYAQLGAARIPEPPSPGKDFDLTIIGMGNSLFRPLITDELIALAERAPRAIGIFGTQYRESLDRSRLDPLLDRLTFWLARYEEDALLYGRGRSNVLHMGDWLIGQFPMAQWTLDQTATAGRQMLEDRPLDRTIQGIQQYRRVLSERVHPLLCALTSAEQVAYRDQREDGSPNGSSGKFRSMLIDVFGRTWPEETWFDVNRDAVASYRARVQNFLVQMPGVLAKVLGLT